MYSSHIDHNPLSVGELFRILGPNFVVKLIINNPSDRL